MLVPAAFVGFIDWNYNYKLITNSVAYNTRMFTAAFSRALQQSLPCTKLTQFLVLIPICLRSILIWSSHLHLDLPKGNIQTKFLAVLGWYRSHTLAENSSPTGNSNSAASHSRISKQFALNLVTMGTGQVGLLFLLIQISFTIQVLKERKD
jgi:hypothetical protein